MEQQTKPPIRIVIADDSPLILKVLGDIFSDRPDIELVGRARDGEEAFRMVTELRPDLLCTDFHMPHMDGLQLIEKLMAEHPLPIIVVSVSVLKEENDQNIFRLLAAGALDVFPKPRGGFNRNSPEALALIDKVKLMSRVKVVRRHHRQPQRPPNQTMVIPPIADVKRGSAVIAIGASTGGPGALLQILSTLPPQFPLPILVVQHVGEGFLDSLVRWLNDNSALRVVIARNGQSPELGTVYFPAEQHHLGLNHFGHLYLSQDPPVNGIYRPSVDYLFRAVAMAAGRHSMGILLTGMGRDGAEGLLQLKNSGAETVAQDEKSSVIYGMPMEAVKLGAVRSQLPLTKIAGHMVNFARNI
ncbi:MAG: chemotaxis-specific protein-glutamate methyltransferase CheB [Gammaproteobacteria bacterium]|nr:chemotaxis-specific protein-glutamate methyltransferase CheB [Gammaproteobacteria bacterium]